MGTLISKQKQNKDLVLNNNNLLETNNVFWQEPIAENLSMSSKIKDFVVEQKTEHQTMQIIETYPFGLQLIIDNHVQSTEVDDVPYHETLVHPSMLFHKSPKRVLIAGGGELATAREVLKYKDLEKLIMVDIDKIVVNFCHKHLGERYGTKHVFDDPRFELIIDDAYKYVKKQSETKHNSFDVVIMDIVDPLVDGPGKRLYTTEFYSMLKKIMNYDALFVTQSGPCGLITHKDSFTKIHNTLEKEFKHVVPYTTHLHSFADTWGFNLAWNDENETMNNFIRTNDSEIVDNLIESKIKEKSSLKYFDGIGFRGQMSLHKPIRESLVAEIMTFD